MMAKMFYSLDEAAAKLGKSEGEVHDMASRGEIDEFRDGDKLIFKVEQIDLLSGDDDHDAGDMSSMIPLTDTGIAGAMAIDLTDSGFGSGSEIAAADTGGGSGLGMEESAMLSLDESQASASALAMGTGMGAADSAEQTGISVFDADDLDEADPSAVTQVSDGGGMEALNLDSMGSGSGLMDLTQEADDTSLGAEGLLDDIFSGDDSGSGGIGGSGETVAAEDTGLFEGTGGMGSDLGEETAAGAGAGAMVAVAAEPYDSRGSGLSGGFALGAAISMLAAIALGIMTEIGNPIEIPFIGTNMLMLVGAMAGITVLFGVVGFLVSGKSK